MLNQVILVGLLIQEYSDENDNMFITLKVSTTPSTRGSDEDYDIISCRISNDFKELKQHLRLGAMVGIKAKITTFKDSEKMIVDAQKITLISNRSVSDE